MFLFGILLVVLKWFLEVLMVSVSKFLKKCKVFVLSFLVKYIIIRFCGGIDGDLWVCFFCGKGSGYNLLGDFYGFYKMKFFKEKIDSILKDGK